MTAILILCAFALIVLALGAYIIQKRCRQSGRSNTDVPSRTSSGQCHVNPVYNSDGMGVYEAAYDTVESPYSNSPAATANADDGGYVTVR
jgi:hypothetical protein